MIGRVGFSAIRKEIELAAVAVPAAGNDVVRISGGERLSVDLADIGKRDIVCYQQNSYPLKEQGLTK